MRGWSQEELSALFSARASDGPRPDAEAFAARLFQALSAQKAQLVQFCMTEAGFDATDAEESIDGSLALLGGFRSRPNAISNVASVPTGGRRIQIRTAPWGTVLAILPQNAFLYLSLVCLVHALDAGNRVVLRAPSAAPSTAQILDEALASLGEPRVSVVKAGAKELVNAFFASPASGLLHYFGGSGRIPDLMAAAFRAGKGFIGDGEGNTWVYADDGFDPARAAEILVQGATRYNGQTCTSINGALIHPSIFNETVALTTGHFRGLVGGLLSDAAAATWCVEQVLASNGEILVGGRFEGARMTPTLVGNPDPTSGLVTEGVFGPAMWVASGTADEFRNLWPTNRYPVCAGLLSDAANVEEWASLPNLARLVVNGDPSMEDAFEPWGGYPGSGNSNVADWHEKYRRPVQVDSPA